MFKNLKLKLKWYSTDLYNKSFKILGYNPQIRQDRLYAGYMFCIFSVLIFAIVLKEYSLPLALLAVLPPLAIWSFVDVNLERKDKQLFDEIRMKESGTAETDGFNGENADEIDKT